MRTLQTVLFKQALKKLIADSGNYTLFSLLSFLTAGTQETRGLEGQFKS